MDGFTFNLAGIGLVAGADRVLHWPERRLLVVSDLHLGRSSRFARRGGPLLPPYDGADTLSRLADAIAASQPATVICLGDSFDDATEAASPATPLAAALAPMMQGRDWIWIAGNHDPGPVGASGRQVQSLRIGPLEFRHQAQRAATGEISGHFHPKARIAASGQRVSRPCFLIDARRVILPAFGTYTGGLSCDDPDLSGLMDPHALAVLCGPRAVPVPMPRRKYRVDGRTPSPG